MIGRNKECLCKCVSKQCSQFKALKLNSTCTEDLSSVIALPDQWIPKKSGPYLTNYLKKLEDNYKARLGKMLKNISVINHDIDKKISDLSEKLYTHTIQNHYTIEDILNDYLIAGDKSPKARDIALQKVEKIYDENVRDIEQLKNDILQQETLRSEELKCKLKSEYKKLHAMENYNPKNILSDINEQISELNDQVFSNLKTNIGFLCQLESHLDEIINYTRSIMNQNCISTSASFENLPENAMEKFDVKKVIMCFVDASQCTISKLCAIFLNDLYDLQKNISFCVKATVSSNFEKIIDRGLQCVLDCCSQYDSDDQIHVYVELMKDTLCDFGDNLCRTYNILYDICYILKSSLVRLALARKLILAQIEDLQIRNDADELTFEISFNIALDQMLTGQDEETVNNKFTLLEDLLEKQAKSYYDHSLNEVNNLKEYLNLVFQVIDMFYSESEYYLKVNSSIYQSSNENIPLASDSDPSLLSFTKLNGFLPRTIIIDKNEHTSLTNWNKKFLISVEEEVTSYGNILNEQAKIWIKEKSLVLNTRYALKSMSHVVRMERIVAARNARITEIRSNDRRLQSHLDTIYQLIGTLTAEGAQFVDFVSKELFPLEHWVTQIQNNIDRLTEQVEVNPELKKLKFKSYSFRLKRYRQLFDESLESAANAYQKNVAVRLQSARVANYNVLNEIKLFHEGGGYAVFEAFKASAALAKASDALESCASIITKDVNSGQTHLLNLAKDLLLPVMQTTGKE